MASWVVPSSLIASSYFLRSTALYSVRGRGGEVEDVEDAEEDTEEEGGKKVEQRIRRMRREEKEVERGV